MEQINKIIGEHIKLVRIKHKKTRGDVADAVKLSQQQIYKILGFLSKNFVIEANLTREVTSDLNRLTSIPCYRGYRHKLSMPLRGQRTSTNARTQRKIGNRVKRKK